MAQSKNRKDMSKSGKRKLSTKGKKVIRRTIAAILMISALIIAAIPTDNSGYAAAGNNVQNMNDYLDYTGDSAEDRNGDFQSSVATSVLDKSSYTTYKSYEIRTINGRETLVWKYEYYIPTGGINGSSVGVISGYNDSYSVDTLNLSGRIYTGYDITAKATFDSFWGSHTTDSFSITGALPTDSQLSDLDRYFSDNSRYTTWLSKYNQARADYIAANGTEPATLADINMSTETLDLTAADMTSERQKLYYCDMNGLRGYTLKEISNYAQGQPYRTSSGTTETIPNESQIYIAVLNNAADITTAGSLYDENGYKFIDAQDIGAIGNNAFKDTKLVYNLVVSDGITLIGDSAFENSFINTVSFSSVTYIGNRVFKNCEYLLSVNLIDQTDVIGKEAFYGCTQLSSISIPKSCKQIGFGAFAECTALKTVSFSSSLGCNVGEYAFYNCPNIDSVTFPLSHSFSFGKACFAMLAGTGTNCKLTKFNFPENLGDYVSYPLDQGFISNPKPDPFYSLSSGYLLYDDHQNSYYSTLGDYMFANRYNLEEITMPYNYGTSSVVRIPMDTFDGCRDIGLLKFDSYTNSYVYFDSNLFEDVENEQLYVFGPQLKTNTNDTPNTSTYANPRYSTWQASSKKLEYVPYVYNDGTKNHYEVGIGDYRYELQINSDGKTANLISCNFTGTPALISTLILPSQVASYDISEMASGCLDPVKDYIVNLVIPDGSIEKIDDNVFMGADELVSVTLGDSVLNIGESAFSSCPKLENVEIGKNIEQVGSQAFYNCPSLETVTWDSPDTLDKLVSIGSNAFYTGSNKLYFHGEVDSSYVPFAYAMGNNKINSDSVRICYISPSPTLFSIIMDENTGLPTLIDYPHYCDLPAALRQKYEAKTPLTDEEEALLNATLFINVPEAVKSIDVAGFLDNDNNNPNRKNWLYISDNPTQLASGYSRQDTYGDNNLKDSNNKLYSDLYSENGGYTAGLFSGYMYETGELNAYGADPLTCEKLTKGNDWIMAVSLPGVTYLPDAAFDSCERLQSVIIGDNCSDIGSSAFQGCSSLSTIGTSNNPYYKFDNYILYENKSDGTLELNTCLPARGTNRQSKEIWVDSTNDPLLSDVTSVNEGAFSSCQFITKADLSDTTVPAIPKNTFDGCTTLTEIKLPTTVKSISASAFDHGASSLDLTLPTDSNISDTAFDDDATVTIWTYPECAITAAYKAANNDEVYIKYLNTQYTITFLNDDLTVFDKIEVDTGRNGYYPETNPTPLLPSNKDYEFSYWYFDNPNGIKNVNENRQAIAIFVPKSSSTSSNNAGGNNGNSGSNGSDNNNNGSGNNNINGNNGNTNNGGVSGNTVSNNGARYNVTVENGAGTGTYSAGQVVTITAYAATTGRTFDRWTTSNTDIGFSNAYATSTTFIMPNHDVKVTATYKNQTASGNSASNNNSNYNNNGTNGGTNGGGTNGTTNGGTTVTVTTEAIDNNNKNLASATVAGSTDNFVVKVTDSAVASAQVEAALKAKYGNDLTGINFIAFDISLYDSTGTYLVENSDNLAVTITLPIPDDLVKYAGNNKVGAVVNGVLEDKAVKFTTIDGVACMTFTATHFSPYTIYVDTNNLVSGVNDLTPKTGFDIEPKWFLSGGMALMGIVLLLWNDKKKVPGSAKA